METLVAIGSIMLICLLVSVGVIGSALCIAWCMGYVWDLMIILPPEPEDANKGEMTETAEERKRSPWMGHR